MAVLAPIPPGSTRRPSWIPSMATRPSTRKRSQQPVIAAQSATKRFDRGPQSTQAFGRGTMSFIRPQNRSVLAFHVRHIRTRSSPCVANLSRSAQATKLDLSAFKDRIPPRCSAARISRRSTRSPHMITLSPGWLTGSSCRSVTNHILHRPEPCPNSKPWWCC